MTLASPIEVINAALNRIGAPAVASLNDHSKQARVANATYEPIVRDWLTRHRWSFATRTDDLTYQGTTTGAWAFVYTLPADVLNVRSVAAGGARVRYEIQAKKVLTDGEYDDLRAVVNYRAPEGEWAPDFMEAILLKLMSNFVRSLREDDVEADRLAAASERQFVLAATRDRNQWTAEDPHTALSEPALARAWRGGPSTRDPWV